MRASQAASRTRGVLSRKKFRTFDEIVCPAVTYFRKMTVVIFDEILCPAVTYLWRLKGWKNDRGHFSWFLILWIIPQRQTQSIRLCNMTAWMTWKQTHSVYVLLWIKKHHSHASLRLSWRRVYSANLSMRLGSLFTKLNACCLVNRQSVAGLAITSLEFLRKFSPAIALSLAKSSLNCFRIRILREPGQYSHRKTSRS